MAADDDSVLRRLPRSRPGSRSGKRDTAGAARRPARPPSSAAGKGARRKAPPRTTRPPEPSANPVEAAARAATGAAGTGLKLASALAREALRRLPRP